MYSARGRIKRLWRYCSSTCAVQPDMRLTAKIGVNKIDGNAERIVRGGGIEIHVRVQILGFLHVLFDAAGGEVEFHVASALAEFLGERAQVCGARVDGVIDAVAEARDLDLVGQAGLHHIHGLVGRARFEQHLHHVFVGAAMQRSFEGGYAGRGGGVDVGKSRGHHAGGKSGSIELVIGMQRQRDVEDVLHHVVRLLAGQGVEEIPRGAQRGIGRDHVLAFAQPVKGGDDSAGLSHQADRLALAGLDRGVLLVRVVERQHGDGGTQHIHGNAFAGSLQERGDFGGNRAVGRERSFQLIQLRLLGEAAVPQQVDDFLKRRVIGERMNVIALIA